MSNFEHSRQEHPEEQDPGIEIVDLEPSESMSTLDKIKRDLLARVEKKHLARPFLLKQGKVQLAALSGVVLVGLIVVLSASGMFSFLLSHLTHPSASPSSDVLLLEQNTLRCLVDTAWSPDNQHRAVLGYGGDCQQRTSRYVPGLVNVYDGHSVALLFSAALSPNPTASRIDGVFLLGKDGKQHVFLRQETPEEANFYTRVMMCEWLILPFRDMKSNAPTMAKCRKQ